ncbi:MULTISPECIES: YncE family protein [Roseivirga]|uniref:YncE family protein n=1 Tax=Roseivirga TaxID=290180 RepID=UPI00257D1979|nr:MULTISPECIES: YncE family protein [Roseivirga]MEC7755443.1 YncE family protein [Bacteroidota bacterium]|tara:strand:- start:9486 stop:10652 length:1167 start_codon:yes stop_codon:yes gene_type:complete
MKKLFTLFGLAIALSVQAQSYYVYVTAESEDEVSVVKFDGKKAETIKTIPVGVWPAEIEGPHGITVGPNGEYWYLSLAHGNPYGMLYKFKTGTDELVGTVQLGLFPASMQVSPVTGLLYCVNFNLHGDMVPSTVSVVDVESMTELDQITTGAMPHGSRLSRDGMKHYSVAMMSGELFEIDALDLVVTKKFDLDEASKMLDMDHSKMDHSAMGHNMTDKGQKEKAMDHSKMDHSAMGHGAMKHSAFKPTWVSPHPSKDLVYVAGNGADEVLEIDTKTWKATRKFKTDKGPYNIDLSPDGKYMVVSYKSAAKTGIWNLETGEELARLNNSQKVTHGVAVSPDSRYAFVSVEGIADDPGMVDVIDLQTLKVVDTAYLGKQAGGIAFWKVED